MNEIRRFFLLFLWFCIQSCTSYLYIRTIAGQGTLGYTDNTTGTSALFYNPIQIWIDSNRNIYVADYSNYVFRKVNGNNIITTFAGTGVQGTVGGNGSAMTIDFQNPYGIAGDTNGRYLYMSDEKFLYRYGISTQFVSIFAGTQTPGFSGDGGSSTDAQINTPRALWLSKSGILYFGDAANFRVRSIDIATGIISAFAGTGGAGFSGDGGPAVNAEISGIRGIYSDTIGNVYIAEVNNARVRVVNASGYISTFAGGGSSGAGNGGPATSAALSYPADITADSTGALYIVERSNCVIRRVVNGIIDAFLGSYGTCATTNKYIADANATLLTPFFAFYYIPTNQLFFTEMSAGYLRVGEFTSSEPTIIPTASPTTWFDLMNVAGTGTNGYSGDNGPATLAQLANPRQIWMDTKNNIYFADYSNFRFRLINSTTNIISTFAGTGTQGTTGGSGLALTVNLQNPFGITGDTIGRYLYLSDERFIYRYAHSTGNVSILAGTSTVGFSGDGGPASLAQLNIPRALYLSKTGLLFIGDAGNFRLRVVNITSGNITTFAGTGGTGFSGDGGPATSAQISGVRGSYMDAAGNVYVAEVNNARVRIISPEGIINTFVGGGTSIDDFVPATSAILAVPLGVTGDESGALYIVERNACVIRKVVNGIITTVMGTNGNCQSSASITGGNYIYSPWFCYLDNNGLLYFSEDNGKIRRMINLPTAMPTYRPTGQPSSQPSSLPSSLPSSHPSHPSSLPSSQPTGQPIPFPTALPTSLPSSQPIPRPTGLPSSQPSRQPSNWPSSQPTGQPSCRPSSRPSTKPSALPSTQPSSQPSARPSTLPSCRPSGQPSQLPTGLPSTQPTSRPSRQPNSVPTNIPTTLPTSSPSYRSSAGPSGVPSLSPSVVPSGQPTDFPSSLPSSVPSGFPTSFPSIQPTSTPSALPSLRPLSVPSSHPTTEPSRRPSSRPTSLPSLAPIGQPSTFPTISPSSHPSRIPICHPSSIPSRHPSSLPSRWPTDIPSSQPTSAPSRQPFASPTAQPSSLPSCQPIGKPSSQPTSQPTTQPSSQPSRLPTALPSSSPTKNTHLTSGTLPAPFPLSVDPRLSNFRISLMIFGTIVSNPLFPVYRNITLPSSSPMYYGENYLILGGRSGSTYSNRPQQIELSNKSYSLETQSNYVLSIPKSLLYDPSPRSVSMVGDLDRNGRNDLVIGDPFQSLVYVLLARSAGYRSLSQGFTVYSPSPLSSRDYFGWCVSAAGDFNGDGFDDVIIGALLSGQAFVVYGQAGGFRDLDLKVSTDLNEVSVINTALKTVVQVSGAGDFNGDGYDDLLISGQEGMSSDNHVVYLLLGQTTKTISWASSKFIRFTSSSRFSFIGMSLSSLGDVNGDGLEDIVIGSLPYKAGYRTQFSYVVYGQKTADLLPMTSRMNFSIVLDQMNSSQGFSIAGGGILVSGVGDVDGDGLNDLVVTRFQQWEGKVGSFLMVYPSKSDGNRFTRRPSFFPTSFPTHSRPPSFAPSLSMKPSPSPSLLPSTSPTSLAPTQRNSSSAKPSISMSPSMVPSSTLSPSLAPSFPPSRLPSRAPSTLKPSASPSCSPSLFPTRVPTQRPSISLAPTKIPTVVPSIDRFPSSSPTGFPTVSSETPPLVIEINAGGLVTLPANDEAVHRPILFVLNTSASVTIDVSSAANKNVQANRGPFHYRILPHANSSLTLVQFSSRDLLDFSEYSGLNSVAHLSYTTEPLVLQLPAKHQTVRLSSRSSMDLTEENFLFSEESSSSSVSSTKSAPFTSRGIWSSLASADIFGSFGVLLGMVLISTIGLFFCCHDRKAKNNLSAKISTSSNLSSTNFPDRRSFLVGSLPVPSPTTSMPVDHHESSKLPPDLSGFSLKMVDESQQERRLSADSSWSSSASSSSAGDSSEEFATLAVDELWTDDDGLENGSARKHNNNDEGSLSDEEDSSWLVSEEEEWGDLY